LKLLQFSLGKLGNGFDHCRDELSPSMHQQVVLALAGALLSPEFIQIECPNHLQVKDSIPVQRVYIAIKIMGLEGAVSVAAVVQSKLQLWSRHGEIHPWTSQECREHSQCENSGG